MDSLQKLQAENATLRESLAQAHERLAKVTYKYGLIAAKVGFEPELHHLKVMEHLAGLEIRRKEVAT
jgi:hypothetical protein